MLIPSLRSRLLLSAIALLPLALAVIAQPPAPAAAPAADPDASAAAPSALPPSAPAQSEAAPAQPDAAPAQPEATPAAPSAPAQPATLPAKDAKKKAEDLQAGGITEDELKQMLVGKDLFLRGCYLDNILSFDEHGHIVGHPPQGSYTLSAFQIDRVRLTKHKVEMEGARFGLRFLGQMANEDPTKALERVRITPKKKIVKITIDREMVVLPKKKKEEKPAKEGEKAKGKGKNAKPAVAAPPEPEEMSADEQLKASIAATPENERPADPKSVTTTVLPSQATQTLKDAIDQIFAQGLDDRMMAAMPDYWRLYYQAVAHRADYRPADPAIHRQNNVDRKARLISNFEPDSNEFAQAAGVAGMAQYHAVIGPDGQVSQIVISRPIGFGLDEIAVDAIRRAKFEPAIDGGQPVAVLINLDVPFRIFSKRTNVHAPPDAADKPAEPQLPGLYSLTKP